MHSVVMAHLAPMEHAEYLGWEPELWTLFVILAGIPPLRKSADPLGTRTKDHWRRRTGLD